MIGERPDNDTFETLFDWPDAVTRLPYDSTDIGAIIEDLDRDPNRQERIRRTGVEQTLKRHDWVYRWEAILKAAGIGPVQRLHDRKDRLRRLADLVSTNNHERLLSPQHPHA
jgi:hypothetical protein